MIWAITERYSNYIFLIKISEGEEKKKTFLDYIDKTKKEKKRRKSLNSFKNIIKKDDLALSWFCFKGAYVSVMFLVIFPILLCSKKKGKKRRRWMRKRNIFHLMQKKRSSFLERETGKCSSWNFPLEIMFR